ncbi:MAG: hypothetical protein J6R47_01995 [Acholeplasmatales bacterium]|nr:hypothetical protein [Acholeplasmatales bacterium]
MERTYICIDLKSFYASVECKARNLDPLTTNLVVADNSRTEKTICLAVSPSLKSYGIPGRARLFEVVQKVKEVNKLRKQEAGFVSGASYDNTKLLADKSLSVDYVIATPQMALYMKISRKIYEIYLKYIAPEDIHVYSIDEVFIDVTNYLSSYKMDAYTLAKTMINDVLSQTGITATAGIGSNMFLAKVAMDVVAKKTKPLADGVRIAKLDDASYRNIIWEHRPITDIWRVGKGYAKRLEKYGIYTMGDVARCSIENENLLYNLFGVNAELLIDHAWGYESCTMKDIKEYKPNNKSIGTAQVIHCAYEYDKAKLVVKEMTDVLSLDLVDKKLLTNQIVLTIGYDIDNLKDDQIMKNYHGEIKKDYDGREVPKHSHGTINLANYTSSTILLVKAIDELFDSIVNKNLLVRRVNISFNNLILESDIDKVDKGFEKISIFDVENTVTPGKVQENNRLEREHRQQQALLEIKKKYGKNAVVKGMNLEDGATTIERNKQIGGHKA